jgi:hypothetical protein
MQAITIDYIYRELMALKDGAKIAWPELLERSGKSRPLVETVVFGRPDYVMRKGRNFTATAKEKATMVRSATFAGTRWPIKLHSQQKVTFTVTPRRNELQVTDIIGVTVELPLPLLPILPLEWVNISVDSANNFLLTTRKMLFSVRLRVNPNGDLTLL